MKKLSCLIFFLILLAIVLPVLAKNSEFNHILNVLWKYTKDFSAWIIDELQKLLQSISHKK